jgi:4-amino-4-deoxy-L-arabinose transferase-like glycosyltransferase
MKEFDINYDSGIGESSYRQILQTFLLLMISTAVFISGISRIALTDPDEGRYALVAKNMVERNNYYQPWLGDHYYADKPPLYFWLTAASLKIFGFHNVNFAVRIVPVCGAILTILAVYLLGSALFNHLIGLMSGFCLLSTVVMIGLGKFVRMDIYLIAFLTLTFWAFVKGYKEQSATGWFLLMYPMIALGILTKGPIALFIPLAVITLFLLWQKLIGQGDGKIVNHMRLILGLACIIVIAGPWFVYMMNIHPEYMKEFFGRQNLARFTASEEFGAHAPFWIYPIVLTVGFLPWSGLVFLAICRYAKNAFKSRNTDWESRFIFLWFAGIVIFFSFSKTRLAHYIFPSFVPASILLARFLYDYWQSDFPRRRKQLSFHWTYSMSLIVCACTVLFYLAGAVMAVWLRFQENWNGLPGFYNGAWWESWGWLVSMSYRVILAVIFAKLFWYLWRNWQLPQLFTAVITAILFLSVDLSYSEFPRIADLMSCRRLIAPIRAHASFDTAILSGPNSNDQRWSLPFYLGNEYPVKQIGNYYEISPYFKNQNRFLLLCPSDDIFNQIRMILKNRVELLADYRETKLLLIKSPLDANPVPSSGPTETTLKE